MLKAVPPCVGAHLEQQLCIPPLPTCASSGVSSWGTWQPQLQHTLTLCMPCMARSMSTAIEVDHSKPCDKPLLSG